MSKRKKKRSIQPRRPPLSLLNKVLYWMLFVLGLVLILSPLLLFTVFQQELGKANGAIAVKGTAAVLLLLIPMFPVIIVGTIGFEVGYVGRIPLIPFRKQAAPKPKKQRPASSVKVIVLAVALWLSTFLPAIGAVYNRVEITPTHIDTYAMFGRLKEHRSLEDAEAVAVRIYYDSGKHSGGWEISYTIRFADGEDFNFQKMPSIVLEIDALFPDLPKTVEGAEHFEKLCNRYDCTAQERQRLKELLLMAD